MLKKIITLLKLSILVSLGYLLFIIIFKNEDVNATELLIEPSDSITENTIGIVFEKITDNINKESETIINKVSIKMKEIKTSLLSPEVVLTDELEEIIDIYGGDISIYYENLENGNTFEYNSNEVWLSASVIKMPLALYVYYLIDQGEISLNDTFTYMSYHYEGGTGSIQYDNVGTIYTIETLLNKSIIESDNIAFIMLRDLVGMNNFYEYVESIGSTSTFYDSGNYTSAYDMCLFFKELYKFEGVNAELYNQFIYLLSNTDIKGDIELALDEEVAHKAGWLWEVNSDSAIIFGDETYTLTILTNHVDDSSNCMQDIAKEINNQHNGITSE